MRPLTSNEAYVLALLLGSGIEESERSRVGRSGLPRATYQSIRRRSYAAGWLFDRFIPAPTALGRTAALFVVAHPFADRAREIQEDWQGRHELVVVWATPQTLFGVAFARDENAAQGLVEGLAPRDRLRSMSYVIAPLSGEGSIPVYFDYEGYWRHLAGLSGPVQYPRGLPRGIPGRGPLSDSAQSTILSLARRPLSPNGGRPLHRLGPFGIPRSQRRLLEANYVAHRALVDPSQLPAFRDHGSDMLVILQGRLEAGATAGGVLERLVRAKIYPFLMAEGGQRFLALFMGQRRRPAEPIEMPAPRSPISLLGVLEGALAEVEVTREDWAELRALVNHRYDRLLDDPER